VWLVCGRASNTRTTLQSRLRATRSPETLNTPAPVALRTSVRQAIRERASASRPLPGTSWYSPKYPRLGALPRSGVNHHGGPRKDAGRTRVRESDQWDQGTPYSLDGGSICSLEPRHTLHPVRSEYGVLCCT
jgi:hypothetical protein